MTPLDQITSSALRELDNKYSNKYQLYTDPYKDGLGYFLPDAWIEIKDYLSHHLSLAYKAGVEEGRK